jgi:hypothetical protein
MDFRMHGAIIKKMTLFSSGTSSAAGLKFS